MIKGTCTLNPLMNLYSLSCLQGKVEHFFFLKVEKEIDALSVMRGIGWITALSTGYQGIDLLRL